VTSQLILHPEVWEDIGNIRQWYGDISPRLADDFGNQVVRLLDRIAEHPAMYARVEADYRRANLSRFPYQVFYLIATKCVWVLGIFPDRADPRTSLRRLVGRERS
jgi:ParE toxin of type II toxin-antitoxin system, parDE